MFGTVLRLLPVAVAPLVDSLVGCIKRTKDRKFAEAASAYGFGYTEALLAGDQERMKESHAEALIRAKFRSLDLAREAAEKKR